MRTHNLNDRLAALEKKLESTEPEIDFEFYARVLTYEDFSFIERLRKRGVRSSRELASSELDIWLVIEEKLINTAHEHRD